ncbi:MAG: hypothetical protein CVT92_12730 [Bacteroidetes bacterium HGW-Bacteroidetes-1]|jgi:hypothetical protein|nr:MAG: hypothetical protein CVT92_12730 [Bacteroidetes bacterium HGW-Bacteroidetes-1]
MKKSFSILLSFILLASHIYLTIGTHFCGGEAVETKIMLGETHLDCGMMVMEASCDTPVKQHENGINFDKVPCCQNEYQTVQTTDEFVKDAAQIAFNVDFAIAFINTTLILDLFSKAVHQFFTEYNPPPIEKDNQVLFQTFLI